jgi:hypothetical protein
MSVGLRRRSHRTNEQKGQLDPSTVQKETTVDSMRLCHLLGHFESRGRYYCGPSVAPCPPLVTRQSRQGIDRMSRHRSMRSLEPEA